jgi:hypothetical protein
VLLASGGEKNLQITSARTANSGKSVGSFFPVDLLMAQNIGNAVGEVSGELD